MIATVLKWMAPVVVAGGLLAPGAGAAPLGSAMALKSAAAPQLEQVRYWGHRGGWGGWHHHGWGYRGGWGWGGIAAGALIGSALASSYYPYYGYGYPAYGPGYYGYPPVVDGYYSSGVGGDIEYCMRRYRTYDPNTGTYIGKGGRRYACP
jgi:hypothetical protein